MWCANQSEPSLLACIWPLLPLLRVVEVACKARGCGLVSHEHYGFGVKALWPCAQCQQGAVYGRAPTNKTVVLGSVSC